MYVSDVSSHARPIHRPAWLADNEWPFDAHPLVVDDRRVAVVDVGHGPPLVFVHTGLWSIIWRELIVRLSPAFQCIAIDAPGTGLSDPPAGEPTLDASARAVAGVIEQLELRRAVLVCHDLGGIAGLAAAARAPDRIGGLVLTNTFAWRPRGTLRPALTVFGSAVVREIDARTAFVARLTATRFGIGRSFGKRGRHVFRRSIDARRARVFHRYLHDALACESLYAEIDDAIRGPLAHLPVLTIFGERNDPFHFQARWKRLFPQAVERVVAGGNHFPMCDDPNAFTSWLSEWHAKHVVTTSSTR